MKNIPSVLYLHWVFHAFFSYIDFSLQKMTYFHASVGIWNRFFHIYPQGILQPTYCQTILHRLAIHMTPELLSPFAF